MASVRSLADPLPPETIVTRARRYGIVALIGFAAAACETPVEPTSTPSQPPGGQNPLPATLPASTFAPCAGCHSSKDGFDLAYFSYADTTIIRRALKHVSLAQAQVIATYIKSLTTPHVSPTTLLWQPGGRVLAGGPNAVGDVAFAMNLFKANAWPTTMTRTALLAINPRSVPVALPLLIWSDEQSTLEWMPADSLPAAILNYNAGTASKALATYTAAPSLSRLEAVIRAVEDAAASTTNAIAPCAVFTARVNYEQCLEIRRWVASLSANYMLRRNQQAFLSTTVHLQWWDVGDIARRSRGLTGQVADYSQQWARWMYLGWQFDPAHEPGIYTAPGLARIGMARHAVWVALRSLVARVPGDFAEDTSPYADWAAFAGNTPAGTAWAYNGAVFALNELVRRVNAGDRPATVALRTIAISQVTNGMTSLKPKVTAAQWTTLDAKATTLRTALKK